MEKINLLEKFSRFSGPWQPHTAAELNGQQVKLVKFHGAFVWHHHADEDEFFYVGPSSFCMEFRNRTVELAVGEFLVVPRAVERRPVAEAEVGVMLFEPGTTIRNEKKPVEKPVGQSASVRVTNHPWSSRVAAS